MDADFCISSAHATSGMKQSDSRTSQPPGGGGGGWKKKKKKKKGGGGGRKQKKIIKKSEALTSKLWNKIIHAAKAYRNGAKLNHIHSLQFHQKSSTDPAKG